MTHHNSKQLWIWLGLLERMENKTEGSDKEDHHPKTKMGRFWWSGSPCCLQMRKLFFTSSIFDNIAIWQALSPAIFRHYKANDSWMSRQFSDNHWCRWERRSLPAFRPFLSADGGSAFQSVVEAKSIAPFSNPGPIIPHLSPEEIQFCSQSVEVGINKEWPIPGGLLLPQFHLLSHVSVSVMPAQ